MQHEAIGDDFHDGFERKDNKKYVFDKLLRHTRKQHVTVNPLTCTLKPHSNEPLYSNTVIGTLAVDG